VSIGHWVAAILTGALAVELWSGAALVPWSILRWPQPEPINPDHFAYRDEHQFACWLAIAFHSAVTAFCWWKAMS